jgi:hypothetical protein
MFLARNAAGRWNAADVIYITKSQLRSWENLSPEMKKLLQIVAIGLLLLLAAQPSFSAALCLIRSASSASACTDCPTAMDEMGMDCPMSQGWAAAPCSYDCCMQAQMLFPAHPVSVERARPAGALFSFAPLQATRDQRLAFSLQPPGPSSGPQRHVLLQVFRI